MITDLNTVDAAWKVMGNTERVVDSPRRTICGGLLSLCLAFFATMFSVQKIDTPLTVALVAFALAIPLLANGYLQSFDKPKSGVPGWQLYAWIFIGAQIAESLGFIPVIVGVYAIIYHFSLLAFRVAFVVGIFVIILPFLSMIIGFTFLAVREIRKSSSSSS